MENIEWNRFVLRANKPIRPNGKGAFKIASKGVIALLIALLSALGLVAASLQSKPAAPLERLTPIPSESRATGNHETKIPVKTPFPSALDAAK